MKRFTLCSIIIIALFIVLSINVKSQTPDSNVVALWHFDEGSGDTLHDASIYHNDGTAYGTTIAPDTFGNARSFNGAGDYIYVPNPSNGSLNFDSSQSFAISVWFKTASSSWGEILRKGVATTPGYIIDITDGHVRGQIGNREDGSPPDSIMRITSNATYNDGVWHHITLTRDRDLRKILLYVDGQEASTPLDDNFPIPLIDDRPLTIGRWENNTYPTYYNGILDEIQISRIPRHITVDSNVVAWWHFDEDSGDTVHDASIYHNDGIAQGTVVVDGKHGKARSFDGVHDVVTTTLHISQQEFPVLTMEAWIKPINFRPYYNPILSGDDGGYDRGFGIMDSIFFIQVGNMGWQPVPADVGVWQHVAVEYTASDIIFYKNGVRYNFGSPGSFGTSTHPLEMGRDTACGYGTCKFNGIIDEVRISKIARDPSEFDFLPAPEDSVVAWWHFDEGSGNILHDASIYHNDGTIYGNTTWVPGKSGSALHFDGLTSYVALPNSVSLQPQNEFTIEAVISLDTLQFPFSLPDTGFAVILSNIGQYPCGGGYQVLLRNFGGFRFEDRVVGCSSNFARFIPFPSAKTFYHVATVYKQLDTNMISLNTYFNGVLVDSSILPQPIQYSSTPYFYIGTNIDGRAVPGGWDGFREFPGIIDEIRITNKALTPHELLVHEEGIQLSVSTMNARPGDTVLVPVTVSFPPAKSYSSAELNFSGFEHNGLEFLGIDTSLSLMNNKGWQIQVNNTDSMLITASAGTQDISGSGVLFNLKFAVTGNQCAFIPITVTKAIFNTGSDAVSTTNGGVNLSAVSLYGDVDGNGHVQAYDASLVLKYAAHVDTLDCQALANADVSLHEGVTAFDATLILLNVVGSISLPYDSVVSAAGTITINNVVFDPNDLVEVPLSLTNGTNIFSFEGSITFDPAVLAYSRIVWSSPVESIQSHVDNNTIHFAGASTTPHNGSGAFATVQFLKVKSNSQSVVTLKTLRWNEQPIKKDVASTTVVTGIDDHNGQKPAQYALSQNYPNPFNPNTSISYSLPTRSSVKLEIFNTLGENIATLVNKTQESGYYNVAWQPNVPSGLYLYRLEAVDVSNPSKTFVQVRKLLFIK